MKTYSVYSETLNNLHHLFRRYVILNLYTNCLTSFWVLGNHTFIYDIIPLLATL